MLREILLGLGVIGLIVMLLIIILLPFVCTVILGVYFAGMLGLSGIVWWAFVILFYMIVMGILGAIL